MVKKSYLAVLLLIPMAVGIAREESGAGSAKEWLERMIRAAQSLNYEGTFVYVQGQNLEAMQIIHGGSQHGERQRMSSLNGLLREVLVADDNVTCLLSRQQLAFNTARYKNRSPFPISLPRELNKLEDYYQFELLDQDRVAGMKTQVVAIRPRDKLRFGYQLWLELETGMVLRSALLNEKGDTVEQLMFTNVQIKPQIDGSLLTLPGLARSSAPSENKLVGEAVTDSDWLVSSLPAGFVKVLHNRFLRSASSKHSTEHIVFTDGLATISVFLEALDGAEPLLNGASQIGAMNGYSTVIDDHQVVVVGEVPPATVQMIAASIRQDRKAAR